MLAFNFADREQSFTGKLLGGQFDVVKATFKGKNYVQGVRQTDLSELNPLARPDKCQVEAGSLSVE